MDRAEDQRSDDAEGAGSSSVSFDLPENPPALLLAELTNDYYQRVSVRLEVLKLLKAAERPVTASELVVAWFNATGKVMKRHTMSAHLERLWSEELVRRVQRGVYRAL